MKENKKISSTFDISITVSDEKVNDVITKGRCHIFYKYLNRNSTYITDEFAEKLIATLPYTPIKGIYLEDEEDFSDHGSKNSDGKIYGIVPENPNFSWEEHLDEDGITRIYASADIFLFTGIYPEINEPGKTFSKGLSMELYGPSIKGEWIQLEDGNFVYRFTEGRFLGLQILGDEVEPCFEGASFFSYFNSIKQLYSLIQEVEKKVDFQLSHHEIYNLLFEALNQDKEENQGYTIVTNVYDTYCIAYNVDSAQYERVFYTKNDSGITINSKESVSMVYLNDEELGKLRSAVSGSEEASVYELISEVSTLSDNFTAEKEKVSTLEAEKQKLEDDKVALNSSIETYQTELEGLKEYKLEKEKQEKEEVISKYSSRLSDEQIENFRKDFDKYTVSTLEKEVAFALVQGNPEFFSLESGRIPKTDPIKSGLAEILSKYEKK